ncbi:MAG TPA: Hsp20/alpha crystallin family protein [Bryobacteraceae bacterium]|nr:Hsp20/alpha crystallin family protein [Bryobacteraceae bacterium]
MAEIDVKKQPQSSEGKGALQRREAGIARRFGDPFSSSSTAPEFFGADPSSWMRRIHDEMDRSFARIFGREGDGGPVTWAPAIEVAEREGKFQVRAELPGLKPEDMKVEITDDSVIIQGERKSEQEETKGGVYRSERRYGQFYREIPLPEGAKAEQAKAQFRDGVLEVTVPAPEQAAKRRAIPIEAQK